MTKIIGNIMLIVALAGAAAACSTTQYEDTPIVRKG